MSNKKKNNTVSVWVHVLVIAVSSVIIGVLGYNAYKFSNNIFDEKAVDTWSDAKQIEVIIPEGVTPKQLAAIMYDNGLTTDETIFYYQIVFSDFKDNIVPGSYKLQTSMKPTEILKYISVEADSDDE